MIWVVVFLAASAVLGGYTSYASQQASIPQLQHRPGTPLSIVEVCRQAAVTAARAHASEVGAELVRVDATSAGPMRHVGKLRVAPVEVGVVYTRAGGPEIRQGTVECTVGRRQGAVLASLPNAER